jgi:hypothetical protein
MAFRRRPRPCASAWGDSAYRRLLHRRRASTPSSPGSRLPFLDASGRGSKPRRVPRLTMYVMRLASPGDDYAPSTGSTPSATGLAVAIAVMLYVANHRVRFHFASRHPSCTERDGDLVGWRSRPLVVRLPATRAGVAVTGAATKLYRMPAVPLIASGSRTRLTAAISSTDDRQAPRQPSVRRTAPTAWLTFFRFNGERARLRQPWYIAPSSGACPSTGPSTFRSHLLAPAAAVWAIVVATPTSSVDPGLPPLAFLSNKVYRQYGSGCCPGSPGAPLMWSSSRSRHRRGGVRDAFVVRSAQGARLVPGAVRGDGDAGWRSGAVSCASSASTSRSNPSAEASLRLSRRVRFGVMSERSGAPRLPPGPQDGAPAVA